MTSVESCYVIRYLGNAKDMPPIVGVAGSEEQATRIIARFVDHYNDNESDYEPFHTYRYVETDGDFTKAIFFKERAEK